MGTSISQPSSKSGTAGKAWKEARQNLANTSTGKSAIASISRALAVEFEGRAAHVIVDNGVKLVYETFTNLKTTESHSLVATQFISAARLKLTQSSRNSFFAELAISAALKSFESTKLSRNSTFMTQYFGSVFNYYVSRDISETFGSEGLLTAEAIRDRLNEVIFEVSKTISTQQSQDIEVVAEIILSQVTS